ncbi:MAG: cytoskeleton protein RodZ [Vibrio sp.]
MTTQHHDDHQPETAQPSIEKVPPGTLLKQKRQELGLTQRQIADRLRLRVSLIERIEENSFEDGLVATFTRGYLRSYAKAVGMSEAEVLCAFDESYGQAPVATQPDMKSFSKKTNRQLHDSRIMLITWVIFAVIIGMSSLWWWQNSQKNNVIPESTPPNMSTLSESSNLDEVSIANQEFASVPPLNDLQDNLPPSEEAIAEPQASEVSDAAAEVDASAVLPNTISSDPVVSVTVPQAAPAVVAAPSQVASTSPDQPSALLVLNFSADCWIQVKDATGKTLSTGVKKAGQSLNLTGQRPYNVVLGAPEGVSITLASEPVDLSGYTSGKVARLTLP